MPQITRRLEWDAGHRIIGHEGLCRFIHGHRYAAEITVEADSLDRIGRVVDYQVIKGVVGSWINENWDHNLILYKLDPLLSADISLADKAKIFGQQRPYVMHNNPTAENLAEHLCQVAQTRLEGQGLKVIAVKIFETPSCSAEFRP